jgi:hypothetical protein
VPRAGCGSAARDPLGLDIEGVDRLARSHEQAVALLAAETHIGAALGQHDAADHRAVGSVDGVSAWPASRASRGVKGLLGCYKSPLLQDFLTL